MTGPHSPWREPADETLDLYPNLVVDDDRVSGSITIGRSRLPVWAIIGTALICGWDEVEAGWSPEEHYGFTAEDLASFLNYLMEMRGEFGRLILALANAERLENDREDAYFASIDDGSGLIDITPGTAAGDNAPGAWWNDAELSAPVIDMLQRCLDALKAAP